MHDAEFVMLMQCFLLMATWVVKVTRSSQKYRWPVVPPEKLGDLLRAYGWSPTDAEAQEYAAKVKKSWKGTHMELLDVLNFIKTEPRPRADASKERELIESAFYMLDKDRNGYIDKAELVEFLQANGEPVPPADVATIFDSYDKNLDGKITLPEFLEVLTTSRQTPPIVPLIDFGNSDNLARYMRSMYKLFDVAGGNGDGNLDEAEMLSLTAFFDQAQNGRESDPEKLAGELKTRMKFLDKDNDGKVSLEEYEAGNRRLVESMSMKLDARTRNRTAIVEAGRNSPRTTR